MAFTMPACKRSRSHALAALLALVLLAAQVDACVFLMGEALDSLVSRAVPEGVGGFNTRRQRANAATQAFMIPIALAPAPSPAWFVRTMPWPPCCTPETHEEPQCMAVHPRVRKS
jgi:hypothetical protein